VGKVQDPFAKGFLDRGGSVDTEVIDAPTYRRVEKAIRYLDEHTGHQPTLAELAEFVGVSPFHLQRIFRRSVGISPKRFLQFLSAEHAGRLLAEGGSLLETSWAAGLSGPGRLHDLMVNVHAMTPGEVRSEGEGVVLRWGVHESPLGACVVGITERGVAVLEFLEEGTDEEAARRVKARWPGSEASEDRVGTEDWARRIFRERKGDGPLTLDVRGTNFQIRVWEALLSVPSGRTVTYGAVAQRLGMASTGAQAVGQAVGANPVAVVIPCHRVIRATGALGGYRWGRERKLALLAREQSRAEVA
jgi:AraC family transcriptional regulator of adaptative response/methylated-DNA-[protein]-cysteine methyltransferase